MDSTSTCVIVADDHPMCREAARIAVAAVSQMEIIEAASLAEVLATRRKAALIMLDLGLPDSKGLASLIDVMREHPQTPVLVVSGNEASDIENRVSAAGAAGFVSKIAPLADLILAVRAVLEGGQYFSGRAGDASAIDDLSRRLQSLTPSEARVLRAMSGGDLNKQIAYELGLSEITVKQHITAIMRKLGVNNRTQAILARQRVELD